MGPNIVFWLSKSYFDIRNMGRISYFDINDPIFIFNLAPKIVFWHSKSYFDIRTEDEYNILAFKILFIHLNWGRYRILTFKILFWHSYWDRKLYFDIQNPILTFILRPNIVFGHCESYFDYQLGHENLILTLKILFWQWNWGRISYFCHSKNPILTFKLGSNIVLWDSKSHFDNRTVAKYCNSTFILVFDIRTEAKYRNLTLKVLFWHSNWGWILYFDIKSYFDIRKSYFDIENPILLSNWSFKSIFDIQILFSTFELRPNIVFENQNSSFEMRPNILFGYSKSYFDIRTKAEYHIFILNIIIWRSNKTEAEYRILTFKILFWHSKWGWISCFDIQNRILTFKQRPNIVFWHSKSYFDIRNEAEHIIWTFSIPFWHSNWGRISYFSHFKILFWH